MASARPLVNESSLPLDLVRHYLDNFHKDIQTALQEAYVTFYQPHELDTDIQMEEMQTIHALATTAESKIHSIQHVVDAHVNGQALHSDGSAYPAASAFTGSVAERTLTHYDNQSLNSNTTTGTSNTTNTNGTGKKGSDGVVRTRNGEAVVCDGCNENHYFKKGGHVICPKGHIPAVLAKANAAKKSRSASYAERTKNNKRKAGPSRNEYNDLKKSVVKLTSAVNDEQSVTSGITDTTTATGGGRNGPYIFVNQVLLSPEVGPASKPSLPVPIDNLIPHLPLPLGTAETQSTSPSIMCVVDTAASLSTGSYDFCSRLAKLHPECVHAIYTNQNYREIILSGIVQVDGRSVTTSLPVAFCFHTPWTTRDGSPCRLVIACGPEVAVNVILGISFLKSTRCLIDLNDNVAIFNALDTPPITLRHKVARLDLPTQHGSPVAVQYSDHKEFLDGLTRLDNAVADVFATLKSGVDDTSPRMPKRSRTSLSNTASDWSVSNLSDDVGNRNSVGSIPISGSAPPNYNPLRDGLAPESSLANYREPTFEVTNNDSNSE